MTYKGYDILAEVPVMQIWDFYIDEYGSLRLSDCHDTGIADDGSVDGFSIEDKDGDQVYEDGGDPIFYTLDEAKAYIDQLVEGSK